MNCSRSRTIEEKCQTLNQILEPGSQSRREFQKLWVKHRSKDIFIAISKNIGNLTTIHYLYKMISEIFNHEQSIILSKLLYSGSHSGDKIECSELYQLESEINIIKEKLDKSDAIVSYFIDTIIELSVISRKESNPIVFV